MRGRPRESRLEGCWGVLRFLFQARVSNDNPTQNPCSETLKYRPDYPRRPFSQAKTEACEWVAGVCSVVQHWHRHSGIKFVTPHFSVTAERSSTICKKRADIYGEGPSRAPYRDAGSQNTPDGWRQPREVWINKHQKAKELGPLAYHQREQL